MSMSETLDDPESKQASSDEDTICPTCGDEFKTEGGMKSHHTQAHGESIAKIEHTCEQCGEKYQTETGYADQSRFCSRECWNDWQNGRSKPSLSGENNPAWNGGKKSLECEWCGDSYQKDPHAADESRFCSQECHGAWQSANLTGEDHHNWNGGKITLECSECNEEFEITPSKSEERRFCSKQCWNSWSSRNIRGEDHPSWEGGKVTLECEVCGDEFKVRPSHAGDRRTCSWECKGAWRSEGFSGEDHPRWKENETLECDFCGEEYTVDPHREDETRFCSEDCWEQFISVERIAIECDHCDDEFTIPTTKTDQRRFCSHECYGQWVSTHRTGQDSPNWRGGKSIYDAVKRQLHGPSWTVRSKQHRKRESECKICGTTEDLHVHHIIPIMSGGTNDEWNLMTLCVGCHNRVEAYTQDIMKPVFVET